MRNGNATGALRGATKRHTAATKIREKRAPRATNGGARHDEV
jgi:hypothetical protein